MAAYEAASRGKIEKQIVLPWSRAIEIAAKSIKIRFWRSMITMGGVVLAIAFLMSIWTGNTFVGALALAEDPGIDVLLQRNGIDPDEIRIGGGGLSERDKWLISLSLLVCIVGIVNAMLMSVAERFREIGTMKCLGALDSFIVKIFFLESTFTGTVGTLLGVTVGFALTLARTTISYKGAIFEYFPFAGVGTAVLISFAVGTTLSIFAAIWPARSAAMMEPVEAMQVRE
jgi:putative ABC transport system permease protein